MLTPVHNEDEKATRRHGQVQCKPLLDAATKDLFRNNAFRITGLSVEATDPEVEKHAHKLKLMADVNRTAAFHTGAVALQPPPTPDQIREATGRLIRDPEVRLIDEFFWFWPCVPGRAAPDPALEALASGNDAAALKIWTANETNANTGVVATHNIALFWQLKALDLEPDNAAPEADPAKEQTLEKYWRNSLKRWKYLISDDLLWDKVASRVRKLGDQRLTDGFVQQMRATLPLSLAKVNAELALGGSDIDKALVSKIIAPRIVEEFGLEEFDWAHAGAPTPKKNIPGGRWRQAFARLKFAAEQVKIELSQKEKATLDSYIVSNLKDESTGKVVIEEWAMDITRDELVRVAEPDIMRSIEIAKRALKEAKLPSSRPPKRPPQPRVR